VKTERLKLATKRTYRAARRAGRPITWKQARYLAEGWCAVMWPDDYIEVGS
jgi:hypothetical protein